MGTVIDFASRLEMRRDNVIFLNSNGENVLMGVNYTKTAFSKREVELMEKQLELLKLEDELELIRNVLYSAWKTVEKDFKGNYAVLDLMQRLSSDWVIEQTSKAG